MKIKRYFLGVQVLIPILAVFAGIIIGIHSADYMPSISLESLLASVTAFAAISGICFTLFTYHQSRNHQALTIRPHISFDIKLEIPSNIEEEHELLIMITNHGNGPAIINKYQILDAPTGRSLAKNYLNIIDEILSRNCLNQLPPTHCQGTHISKGESLGASKSIRLYETRFKLGSGNGMNYDNATAEILLNIEFKIEYQCLHLNNFEASTKQLHPIIHHD